MKEKNYEYISKRINNISNYLEGFLSGAGIEKDKRAPIMSKLESLDLLCLKLRDGFTIEQALGLEERQ